MVHLTETESELAEQLLSEISETIRDVPDADIAYANKTKIQKLLFFAIDEFDLPVTYSWYLAGAVVPDRSIGSSSMNGPQNSLSSPAGPTMPETDDKQNKSDKGTPSIDPVLFDNTGDPSNPSEPSPDLYSYVSHDELTAFYRRVIPTVWHQETMRFLQNFYQETAPERYRLLYIESTHLRTHLSELATTVERHIGEETPTRSISELRQAIELAISDFHYYLRGDEQLKETFDVVVSGTDVIEDALMMLDQRPVSSLSAVHLEAIRELQDFFFYYVWKYPCLLISQMTASGPRADELRSDHATEFEPFDEVVRGEQTTLSSTLVNADLKPGPNDYPPVDDRQLSETLRNLSTEYLE